VAKTFYRRTIIIGVQKLTTGPEKSFYRLVGCSLFSPCALTIYYNLSGLYYINILTIINEAPSLSLVSDAQSCGIILTTL
jgi:hypothetical protein